MWWIKGRLDRWAETIPTNPPEEHSRSTNGFAGIVDDLMKQREDN